MLKRFYNRRDFRELNQKKIKKIEGLYVGSKEIQIYCADGTAYKLYHQQDAYEDVSVVDISCFDCCENLVTNPQYQAALVSDARIYTANPLISQTTSNMQLVYKDKPYIRHRVGNELNIVDEISLSETTTVFKIKSEFGSLTITWRGIAYDYETSTEVDFVQIAGEGLWK